MMMGLQYYFFYLLQNEITSKIRSFACITLCYTIRNNIAINFLRACSSASLYTYQYNLSANSYFLSSLLRPKTTSTLLRRQSLQQNPSISYIMLHVRIASPGPRPEWHWQREHKGPIESNIERNRRQSVTCCRDSWSSKDMDSSRCHSRGYRRTIDVCEPTGCLHINTALIRLLHHSQSAPLEINTTKDDTAANKAAQQVSGDLTAFSSNWVKAFGSATSKYRFGQTNALGPHMNAAVVHTQHVLRINISKAPLQFPVPDAKSRPLIAEVKCYQRMAWIPRKEMQHRPSWNEKSNCASKCNMSQIVYESRQLLSWLVGASSWWRTRLFSVNDLFPVQERVVFNYSRFR